MQSEAPRWLIQHQGARVLRLEPRDARSSEFRRYHVQKERLVAPFGRTLPPLLEDLVDLALTVYAADRLIRRRPPGTSKEHRCWQRHFEIELPVVDPERWTRPEVHHRLTDLLAFVTEDRWDFRFVQRTSSGEIGEGQSVLVPPEPPVGGALFSGGLDSLAGLAIDLDRSDLRTLVILTCSTNSQLLPRQRELLKALVHQPKVRLIPVVVPLRLGQDRREYDRNEPSQRSRGFLFGVLGCVASLMAGARELSIYENGVGAINLPISPAQLGAESSRSVHPVALWKLEQFLRLVLEQDFRLRLPLLFSTKGEMCSALRKSRFSPLALRTISCDGFPARVKGPEHCGTCTSCLLRRQALWTGGFSQDQEPQRYRRDLLAGVEGLPPAHLAPLWDMLGQVEKLEGALASPRSWSSLAIEFPDLLETRDVVRDWLSPIARAAVEEKLTALYRSYCHEWHEFPARPPGWTSSSPEFRQTA